MLKNHSLPKVDRKIMCRKMGKGRTEDAWGATKHVLTHCASWKQLEHGAGKRLSPVGARPLNTPHVGLPLATAGWMTPGASRRSSP